MRLTDNTILVTGGGSGIGRGLAVALHRAGNRVVIAGRRLDALRAVAEENPGIEYLQLDLTDTASIRGFVADIERRYPDLNVVVNNAGVMALEDVDTPDPDTVSAVIATNLIGPITLTALLIPGLKSRPNAAVVNITSALAFVPMAIAPTYSATKAGLHAYTESVRFLLQDSKIQVIEVAPPRVETEMDGPGDAFTMTIEQFVEEMLCLMSAHPDADEVVVSAARGLREAERNGVYAEQFAMVNPDPSFNPWV
jgi:uncharacterized oxidoreductase